jgi:hypothetical protein
MPQSTAKMAAPAIIRSGASSDENKTRFDMETRLSNAAKLSGSYFLGRSLHPTTSV